MAEAASFGYQLLPTPLMAETPAPSTLPFRAGQYNKLVQRVRRGNLDVVWNIEDSSERLQEVRTLGPEGDAGAMPATPCSLHPSSNQPTSGRSRRGG